MQWRRSYTTHTSASLDAVWKRHVTPEDWVEDDAGLDAAAFSVPVREGDRGTITSGGKTREFTFVEVTPKRSMTQVIPLPGGRLILEHKFDEDEHGLRVTHGVCLEGPLLPLLVPLAGWPLVKSRPPLVLGMLARALRDDQAGEQAVIS